MLSGRIEEWGVYKGGYRAVCPLGASMEELAVRSGLLIISAVLLIAIAAAIFRAFTRKDKQDE